MIQPGKPRARAPAPVQVLLPNRRPDAPEESSSDEEDSDSTDSHERSSDTIPPVTSPSARALVSTLLSPAHIFPPIFTRPLFTRQSREEYRYDIACYINECEGPGKNPNITCPYITRISLPIITRPTLTSPGKPNNIPYLYPVQKYI